jgi:hypothetical protein
MYCIRARNVNDAWQQAKALLNSRHIERPSRVGDVWEYPEPVTTRYERPAERVLFDPLRDANPFFHFMEGLWTLAGRNDATWLAQFNKRVMEFSDDGVTWHDAYGYRWRKYFDMIGGAEEDFTDQLPKIIRMLKRSHDERRAVLQMWDPVEDLERPELKALPCNLCVCFKIREGRLTMTVMNRSNDIVWGAYGSNVVVFSMLQEYIAVHVGVPMGEYYQVSDSWHAYTERWEAYGGNVIRTGDDYYASGLVKPYPLVEDPSCWDDELQHWMEASAGSESDDKYQYRNSVFPKVAWPLLTAHRFYRQGDLVNAIRVVNQQCAATDWQAAAREWLLRRWNKRQQRQSGVSQWTVATSSKACG